MNRIVRIILIIVGVAGVLGAAVWIRGQAGQSDASSQYNTSPAARGPLTDYVGATGSVRSNQTATLIWQTGGTVGEVLVQKDERVESGAVLSSLLQTSLSQGIILAQADLINAEEALDKVLDNSEARAAAQLALVQAEKALEDAQKESQSKLYQRAGANTIDIARANLILAEEALDEAEKAYERVAGRSTEDSIYAAALSQLARARQERDRAQYNLYYVEGLPSPLDIEEVDARLTQAEANLQSARNEWERIKDGPDSRDIAAAEARIAAARATLNLAHLAAPFSGTITLVDVKPGDQVSAGTRAFQIDDLSRLLVEVQVSEVDINRVKIGQPVTLSFDAIQDKEYTATVVDIATVGQIATGVVNFTVTVEVSQPDENIKPGMTAAVNIAVTQLENVLLVPNQAVRVVNGQRVVYVLRNNAAVMEKITLGATSNTFSQVVSDNIKEGDLIILNPPAAAMTGPMGGGPFGGN